jgi:murein DD-endopeptidase MepM/ murein hydrolase activator NlpD
MTAARTAIARARMARATLLAAVTLATLATPVCGTACAANASADSSGNAPANASGGTANASGGTAAPVAASAREAVDVAGVGGTQAPRSKGTGGTGGSEYGVAQASAKTSHRAHRSSDAKHPKPKPRPAPKRKPARMPKPAKPKPAPKPKPVPKPKPAPSPPPAVAPGLSTPAQTAEEGAVFPVRGPHSFGGPENRFGAARSGHVHEGQDVLAAEGVLNVAPLAGTIITTGYQTAGAGWYVAEHTASFDLFFAHCQAGSVAVSAGQAVAAGTAVCKVGQTGDATGPHLHFEMWVGGWQAKGGYPIDPLPYLEAWEGH